MLSGRSKSGPLISSPRSRHAKIARFTCREQTIGWQVTSEHFRVYMFPCTKLLMSLPCDWEVEDAVLESGHEVTDDSSFGS